MPDVGVPELLIILVIVILVFGVGKLPQIGSALGQSIREFRKASKELSEGSADSEPQVKASAAKEQSDTASESKAA
jgi:sec-independent protein translocase protein TatA